MRYQTKRDLIIGICIGLLFYFLIFVPISKLVNVIESIKEKPLTIYFKET